MALPVPFSLLHNLAVLKQHQLVLFGFNVLAIIFLPKSLDSPLAFENSGLFLDA